MQPTIRQDYLDWLRIFAIIGVLLFHAAMPFATEEWWHIKNKETSDTLLEFNFWLSRFRMPLLFFISGAVTWFMIQKRTAGSFIGLRFRRLFIPLLFGMLVIVPPQIYMERITQGFKGTFLDFYPSIFSGEPYPKGNTSWHHLWFIAYLFVFNLIAAPLFRWVTTAKGKAFIPRLDWLGKGKRIYLLILPGVIAYTSLVLKFPQTNDLVHDWAYLPYWFLFLFIGFICILRPALMDSLERNRRFSLLTGMVLFITMNYFRWNDLEPWSGSNANWRLEPFTYAYLALYPAVAWFWVMALTGYGKKYLNRKTKFSGYATEAVYPFYILHQTVIVILAYYVVQANDDVFSKYLFLSIVSFVLSVAIYHLLIKPYAVMRFLFGLKGKTKKDIVVQTVTSSQQLKDRILTSACATS
ncbi:MAG TPA: acyltransferase family protein [Chitinophagaceae bacterium]